MALACGESRDSASLAEARWAIRPHARAGRARPRSAQAAATTGRRNQTHEARALFRSTDRAGSSAPGSGWSRREDCNCARLHGGSRLLARLRIFA